MDQIAAILRTQDDLACERVTGISQTFTAFCWEGGIDFKIFIYICVYLHIQNMYIYSIYPTTLMYGYLWFIYLPKFLAVFLEVR